MEEIGHTCTQELLLKINDQRPDLVEEAMEIQSKLLDDSVDTRPDIVSSIQSIKTKLVQATPSEIESFRQGSKHDQELSKQEGSLTHKIQQRGG